LSDPAANLVFHSVAGERRCCRCYAFVAVREFPYRYLFSIVGGKAKIDCLSANDYIDVGQIKRIL
jgi:hypothetical protein